MKRTSKNNAASEKDTEMNFLEKNGNDIIFFEHATDADKRVRMYITK